MLKKKKEKFDVGGLGNIEGKDKDFWEDYTPLVRNVVKGVEHWTAPFWEVGR